MDSEQQPINPSYIHACPACRKKIIHNDEQWELFHPLNRTGQDLRDKKIEKESK